MFDILSQFLFCFRAIDGCHIPIKCPVGGLEPNREYLNFQKFLFCYFDSRG